MSAPDATAANGGSLDSLKGNAQAAYDQISNGPVAQNVKEQGAITGNQLNSLAATRKTPAAPAATGQPLTHYHSFFSSLLAWENPRASAIAYASIVTLIFATRYLNIVRYSLKLTWMALGTTVLAEVAGRAVLNNGLATSLRPRKYYTVPRETLDVLIGDVHELINFFVIESQRILFAENIGASVAALVGTFIAYFLVKIVPYWGLALIGTTALFGLPLIYTSNQELIDSQIRQASNVVNSQTEQFRTVASKHSSQAANITKQYVGDYTAKAQELLRGNKKGVNESDFPAAPKDQFKTDPATAPAVPTTEPAGHATEPAFHTTEPAFHSTEPVVPTTEPAHKEPLII